MGEVRVDDSLELGDQLMHALGRQVELEQLDRDQPFPRCVVGPENGTERAGADLMKNTKRSERVRKRTTRSFGVQRRISSGRRVHRNTEWTQPDAGDRRLTAVRSSE